MPRATDFAGFGAVGVPVFNSPATGNSAQTPGLTWAKTDLVKPVSWNFNVVTNTPTVTDKLDRMVLQGANSANIKSVQQPLQTGAPYTIDCAFMESTSVSSGDSAGCGIVIGDGTKILTSLVSGVTTGGIRWIQGNWTNSTTLSVNVRQQCWSTSQGLIFLRVTDDGTTRTYYASSNGKDYAFMASDATNTFLTPTQCGVGVYCNNGLATCITVMSVYHFQVSYTILGDAP